MPPPLASNHPDEHFSLFRHVHIGLREFAVLSSELRRYIILYPEALSIVKVLRQPIKRCEKESCCVYCWTAADSLHDGSLRQHLFNMEQIASQIIMGLNRYKHIHSTLCPTTQPRLVSSEWKYFSKCHLSLNNKCVPQGQPSSLLFKPFFSFLLQTIFQIEFPVKESCTRMCCVGTT